MCCTSDAAVKCDGHCLHGLSGVSSGSQDAYEACVMSVWAITSVEFGVMFF